MFLLFPKFLAQEYIHRRIEYKPIFKEACILVRKLNNELLNRYQIIEVCNGTMMCKKVVEETKSSVLFWIE